MGRRDICSMPFNTCKMAAFTSRLFLRLFGRSEGQSDDPMALLSPRELEVFTQLVNGLRAKDIAERLDISPKTVDTYRASLMRKLNVQDLVGLVKFAIERNLTSTSVER